MAPTEHGDENTLGGAQEWKSSRFGGFDMADTRQTAESAVVLRLRRPSPHGEVVWFEYAPVVNGAPQRQSHHMMASPESAAKLARQHGYEPADTVIDFDIP